MKKKRITALRAGLMVTALAMITIGAVRGEVETVLSKAIKLCLECVGIG